MPTENENAKVTVQENEDGSITIVVPEGVEVEVLQKEEEAVTTAPSQLDGILTLGLVGALALAVIAVIVRKATQNKKSDVQTPAPVAPAAPVELPKAPGTAGQLKLHSVEPKTAAMLMAIVADKLQKPINELRFISIKEVE
ncbi:MAG: hypothetical protein E7453_05035 [Ruminococcaceae bacterium]|nr:hypothetical protein [Oscillospiraceae bacterium]